MVSGWSSTQQPIKIRTGATVCYHSTDATSSCGPTTSATIYYDDTVYELDTVPCMQDYEDLLASIKLNKVYPWELESPILKFVKPIIVYEPPVFNRKLFINAYKSSRSTLAKFN